jgi:glycosyltransferase involved in cell wall biosynthesis
MQRRDPRGAAWENISTKTKAMSKKDVRVCVCQLGARLHYGAARSFEQNGILSSLITDICGVRGWPALLSALPPSLRPAPMRRLLGRVPVGIPPAKIVSFPFMGVEYYFRLSRCRTEADRLRTYHKIDRKFGTLASRSGFKEATHVYTFSSAALEIIEAAHSAGLHTIVEQPIAALEVQQQIMEEEIAKYPGWEPHSECRAAMTDSIERQRSEWKIADTVIVPSKFVANSLEQVGISTKRVVIVPYGVSDKFRQIERQRHDGPLRVLSVGGLVLRKGPQYTAEAAKIAGNHFEFRLVGKSLLSDVARREFGANISCVGQVPRSEISSHFEWADVFLLPSLCEGMATVLIEALAAGLPVITTPNSGLEVRDGVDGFAVPIRDANAIASRLDQLASDPHLLAHMSKNARERSAEFTLAAYGDRLLQELCPGLSSLASTT